MDGETLSLACRSNLPIGVYVMQAWGLPVVIPLRLDPADRVRPLSLCCHRCRHYCRCLRPDCWVAPPPARRPVLRPAHPAALPPDRRPALPARAPPNCRPCAAFHHRHRRRVRAARRASGQQLGRERRFGIGSLGPALRRREFRLHGVQVARGPALRLLGGREPISEGRGLRFQLRATFCLRHRGIARLAACRRQFRTQVVGRPLALLTRGALVVQFGVIVLSAQFLALCNEKGLSINGLQYLTACDSFH